MSDTQLLSLRESSKQDSNKNAVVESYVEGPPEAYGESPQSTVQVTLAKRILLAGSNRVLCLGASTSVPINEDEKASVSDLALRLSDGTNVALSLSFFNDELGNIVPMTRTALSNTPINRVTFEPLRYASKDESKLGIVLGTMAFVVIAGIYFVLPDAFSKFMHVAVTKYAAHKSAALATTDKTPEKAIASTKPVLGSLVSNSTIPKSTVPKSVKPKTLATTVTSTKDAIKDSDVPSKVSLKKSPQKNSEHQAKSRTIETHTLKHSHLGQSKMMFIPPPPPTEYGMPPANSPYWTLSPPPPRQEINEKQANSLSMPKLQTSQPLQPSQATAPRDEQPAPKRSVAANSDSLPAILTDLGIELPSKSKSTNVTSSSVHSEPPHQTTHSDTIWESTNANAPLPGIGSDTLHLERIVPPGQLNQ